MTPTDIQRRRSTTPPAARLLAPAVGDFHGDQKPDLAVANQSNNTVRVLLNERT